MPRTAWRKDRSKTDAQEFPLSVGCRGHTHGIGESSLSFPINLLYSTDLLGVAKKRLSVCADSNFSKAIYKSRDRCLTCKLLVCFRA